jgi:hypothetical protein
MKSIKVAPKTARFDVPLVLTSSADIARPGGGGNGMTNFGDIRFLKRLIYAIGSGLPVLSQLWSDLWSDGFSNM